jgi:23S rRNA pseudouridine2605 synthase
METEEIRIQKYMSDCGVMSRRAAEDEIRAGRIYINGKPAGLGQKVLCGRDEIKYNGKIIIPLKSVNKVYIMLNKPVGYVTTLSDDRGRKCVAELVTDIGTRVYPCGRLDMESEGLLLLTNDGDLANKLTHPGHNIPKIYHVRISSEIMPEQLRALGQTMIIDDYKIAPVLVTIVTRKEGFTILRMELQEGRNRQIRKMCDLVGLDIVRLQRIAVGDITLGDLKTGKWKMLNANQIKYLKGIK